MTSVTPVEVRGSDLDAEAAYMSRVVVWNVKMILTAHDLSQTSLANALGIKRAAMSKKLKGDIAWSLEDLVRAALFLGTTPQKLMDDSLMREMLFSDEKSKEAIGVMPTASDGLPRLGLNQRHSD